MMVRSPVLAPRPLLLTLSLLGALLPAQALAQSARQTTLTSAVGATLPINADVKTAQANVTQAQAAAAAAQADPSALVAARLDAANTLSLSQAQLRSARLMTLQTTVQAYTTLLEAQENVELLAFQVGTLQKAVQVAQVKLNTGNATPLDVQNAQNALSGGQQNLAAAQAQLGLASGKLSTLMGAGSAMRAAGAPNFPNLSASLGTLQQGLPRLTTLVGANNALAEAQLDVKLASNDFTPAQTLQKAQTALANAQRALSSAQTTTSQALASAYQAAQNAAELLKVAQNKEAAALKTYNQDAARLKSGTIAATQLATTQLTLKQAQYARLQAQDDVLVALAALSVAAGQNLTGVGGAV